MNDTKKPSNYPNGKKAGPVPGNKGGPRSLTRGGKAGILLMLSVLFLSSVLSGLSFKPGVKVFLAGDIATQDVMADQDLLVEERESTEDKREQVAKSQPPIFDLSREAHKRLSGKITNILNILNSASNPELEQVRWQAAEILNTEVDRQTFNILRNNEIQNLLIIRVLPWIEGRLNQGVVSDTRLVLQFKNGIVVRDPVTSEERLLLDSGLLRDTPRLMNELGLFLRNELNKSLRTRKAIQDLIEPLLHPSLNLNPYATQEKIKEIMASVEPVYYHIKKGEVIVRQGERVTIQDQLKLQALFSQEPEYFQLFKPVGVFLLGVFFMVGFMLSPTGPILKPLQDRDALLIGSVLLLFAVISKILFVIEPPLAEKLLYVSKDVFPLVLPLAGGGGLMALFLPLGVCFVANLLLAFVCCQMVSGGLGLFSFYFLSSMLNTVLIKRSQTRAEVMKSVFPLLAGLIVAWAGVHFLNSQGGQGIGVAVPFVIVNGLLSLLIVLALSPIAEMLFGYTSRFRLMELMNLEQPLLQELMVVAPGTYHHSLIVANMVEAGARAIGANALLCKVAALYHDIGKLKKPQYFIENQYGGKNPHDKLAPSMSALILISHVKKGVELAEEHKLGPEITGIIQQHHGSSLISYFHHKAVEQAEARGGEPVRDEDYRYPGPKPQTREAGVVLLADAIEASSRSLLDPTPSRIKGHIETMTKRIFSEGQLDESALTFKDLHLLSETFHRILTGIFHQRIEYPSGQKPDFRQPRHVAVEGHGKRKNPQPKAVSGGRGE